ncbi:MAG: Zn-dependent oligopeptidase [Candidatus Moranbacteria bacterium]|nr:Zn-dependent oligopeptidase [Candidatus Moranbacteria bacterium]
MKLYNHEVMNHIRYSKKDFVWTRWAPEEIGAAVKRAVAEKRKIYEAVKRIPAGERTFENTVAAVDASNRPLSETLKAALLMNVSSDPKVREAAQKATEYADRAIIGLEYDETLYRALVEYEAKQEKLRGAEKKLLGDFLRSFRRRGFDLSEVLQEKLRSNLKELSKLGSAFSRNLNEYHDAIEVEAGELRGLSPEYVKSLPRRDGKCIVTLDYPSLVPFMENAESEERRRELSEKNWRKGGKKNVALLEKMIRLREENAKLLGYPTHADFRTEDRMAKDAETVFRFLGKIMKSLSKQAEKDAEELLVFKEGGKGQSLTSGLQSHDVAYLSNRLKKKKYAVDDDLMREYFPIDHVREAIFSLFGNLFGISFERLPWKLWYKDAELYVIRNTGSDEHIAYFAFDLYPREGKYGHAAVFNVISGHETDDGFIPPFATLVTNFPKPSRNRPSLLSHDEVVTFLHEFGHLMHESLSEARYVSQAGFSVAWDFVEAMSQMCEFFAWDERVLRKISRHFKTGKPLPPALIRKMRESKKHLLAYDTKRQAMQALFDMMVHSGNLRGTLPEYFRVLSEVHLSVKIPESSLYPAGFGHLAGGYDAGYYGYLWSRVYAADFFTKFREAGVISPLVGMRYRKDVLAKGSSEPETRIAKSFLGRKLSDKAFLEDIGID